MRYSSCLKTVPFDSIPVVKTTFFYDIPWDGLCVYEGKLYRFESEDTTDYQYMTDCCPYCNGSSEDVNLCECTAYVNVECNLFNPSLLNSVLFKLALLVPSMSFFLGFNLNGLKNEAR